jgi:raffinose/stachyose/melibiose transport system substrate-binding protein
MRWFVQTAQQLQAHVRGGHLAKRAGAIIMCGLLIWGLTGLSACEQTSEFEQGAQSQATAPTGVYFFNFKPEQDAAYQKIAAAYTQQTGVPVVVKTAANDTYADQLAAELSKVDAPTIFEVTGAQGLARFGSYAADLSGSQLFAQLTDQGMALKGLTGANTGKPVAMPFALEGYGVLVNNRVLKRYFALPHPVVKRLDDVDDFKSFKALVTDIQAKRHQLGIYGAFAPTSLAPGEAWRWSTHLLNVPLYYEWGKKAPRTNENGVATSFKFKYNKEFRQLFDLYLDNSTEKRGNTSAVSVTRSMNVFARGECAMVQNGNWSWSQIVRALQKAGTKGIANRNVPSASTDSDDIRFLPLYCGFKGEQDQGLCVGCENYYCVNTMASEGNQQASIAFLDWLYTSPQGIDLVNDDLGFWAPFKTFSPEDEAKGNPLTRQVMEWSNTQGIDQLPWVFEEMPGTDFKSAFALDLQKYALGYLTWDKLVKDNVASWKQAVAASDKAAGDKKGGA